MNSPEFRKDNNKFPDIGFGKLLPLLLVLQVITGCAQDIRQQALGNLADNLQKNGQRLDETAQCKRNIHPLNGKFLDQSALMASLKKYLQLAGYTLIRSLQFNGKTVILIKDNLDNYKTYRVDPTFSINGMSNGAEITCVQTAAPIRLTEIPGGKETYEKIEEVSRGLAEIKAGIKKNQNGTNKEVIKEIGKTKKQ